MRWFRGGSLPALYSLGGRVTSQLDLDLFGYMVIIYKEYDIYHIRTDPSLNSRFFWLPCGARRPEPSTVGLDLMGWTSLGAAHVHCHRYLGLYPPQRLTRMVCSEDTKIYTGLGGTSLRLVCCCSCYRHLVCSRDYKQARERRSQVSSQKSESS